MKPKRVPPSPALTVETDGQPGWVRDLLRHGAPDLVAASVCLVLVLPGLAYSGWARGMADAVHLQILMVFLDIPVIYVLALTQRLGRTMQSCSVFVVYAAEAAAFAHLASAAGALDAGFAFFLLLPILLRAVSVTMALRDGVDGQILIGVNLTFCVPWLLAFLLVAAPLSRMLDPGAGSADAEAAELLPPSVNAAGAFYFSAVAAIRVGVARWSRRTHDAAGWH